SRALVRKDCGRTAKAVGPLPRKDVGEKFALVYVACRAPQRAFARKSGAGEVANVGVVSGPRCSTFGTRHANRIATLRCLVATQGPLQPAPIPPPSRSRRNRT